MRLSTSSTGTLWGVQRNYVSVQYLGFFVNNRLNMIQISVAEFNWALIEEGTSESHRLPAQLSGPLYLASGIVCSGSIEDFIFLLKVSKPSKRNHGLQAVCDFIFLLDDTNVWNPTSIVVQAWLAIRSSSSDKLCSISRIDLITGSSPWNLQNWLISTVLGWGGGPMDLALQLWDWCPMIPLQGNRKVNWQITRHGNRILGLPSGETNKCMAS